MEEIGGAHTLSAALVENPLQYILALLSVAIRGDYTRFSVPYASFEIPRAFSTYHFRFWRSDAARVG